MLSCSVLKETPDKFYLEILTWVGRVLRPEVDRVVLLILRLSKLLLLLLQRWIVGIILVSVRFRRITRMTRRIDGRLRRWRPWSGHSVFSRRISAVVDLRRCDCSQRTVVVVVTVRFGRSEGWKVAEWTDWADIWADVRKKKDKSLEKKQ